AEGDRSEDADDEREEIAHNKDSLVCIALASFTHTHTHTSRRKFHNRHRNRLSRYVTLDHVNANLSLALFADLSLLLKAQDFDPDPWQRDLMHSKQSYLLLNCARQTGKSTTVAAIAL